jgi:DNA-binding transcriptional regulator YhcF (GntR family)
LDILLNRRSAVPIRHQIAKQLELRIFAGQLRAGDRLPSVRSLSRLLKVHPNTVSAAYRDLQGTRHVELHRGAGVFVVGEQPSRSELDLTGLLRTALHQAVERGFSAEEIRAAIDKLLNPAVVPRLAVVDPRSETREILLNEIHKELGVKASAHGIEDIRANPSLLEGVAAMVAFPPHASGLAALAPGVPIQLIHAGLADEDRRSILALPSGSTVLIVSRSPLLLSMASVVVRSLRDDDVVCECRPESAARAWKRVAPAADVVFADALCVEAVRTARPRKLRELRLIGNVDLAHLKEILGVNGIAGRPRPAKS